MIQAVRSTVQLIGNANANMSHLLRERIISDLNKTLSPIVGDTFNFKDAATFLLAQFAKRGKEMVD